MRRGQYAFVEAYLHSVPVQKLKAGAREVVVADRDGTIQPFPQPVAAVLQTEITAGKELRAMTAELPFIEASAQAIERAIDSDAYGVSVKKYGFRRPRPTLTLPDGRITYNPGDVPEWEYLHNPDGFLGFGDGVYLRRDGGYVTDWEFHKALGGDEWRPRFFEDLELLKRTLPDIDLDQCLGVIDKRGVERNPEADGAPLSFRAQFDNDHTSRLRIWTAAEAVKLKGEAFQTVEWTDESNPLKGRFTTFAVSRLGQKHLVLERFGNELSFASGVPINQLTFYKIGDAPNDVLSGLVSLQGAREVILIMAANSRLSESIINNESEFAGFPLPGSPDHPLVRGRYHPTEMPGVYWWKGEDYPRPRQVVVADKTPFAAGLGCTESVLVCLKYLRYGPRLRP